MKKPAEQKPPAARSLLAYNVRSLRIELGLSQEALGIAAGFHRTYVSQVERGVANVTIDGLDRLATAVGVPVASLLAPLPVGGASPIARAQGA